MGGDITTPYKKLGTWLSRTFDTVYQAATDGFVCVYSIQVANPIIELYTDNNNPPTTLVSKSFISIVSTSIANVNSPVKKGDYWEVTGTVVVTVWWIPLEP